MSNKPSSIEAWLAALGDPSADRDYQPGHARMQKLLADLSLIRPRLRIRVAGTNGKGSTAHMLAAALKANGLKVGLYTSPHILDFNERIRIDGEPIADAELLASLEALMPKALAAGASYFETATALALERFTAHAVDAEILEAGVGARLDATTAVPADMALLTPIGIDHQAWLGESLAEIASEKAHAMQGCRWSFSAPQPEAVAQVLRDFNSDIRFIAPDQQRWQGLKTPGAHQRTNASLAFAAIEALQGDGGVNIDPGRAAAAILECRVPGRLKHVRIGEADVWLDAAHNAHAVEALFPSLRSLADPFDAILVFTREDRSLADSLPLLRPYCRRLVSNNGDQPETASPAEALQREIAQVPNGSFLVLGSFITIATVLRESP